MSEDGREKEKGSPALCRGPEGAGKVIASDMEGLSVSSTFLVVLDGGLDAFHFFLSVLSYVMNFGRMFVGLIHKFFHSVGLRHVVALQSYITAP
jgi:hypothetical protein